jgi:hypothetical protein
MESNYIQIRQFRVDIEKRFAYSEYSIDYFEFMKEYVVLEVEMNCNSYETTTLLELHLNSWLKKYFIRKLFERVFVLMCKLIFILKIFVL